jgi:hypothetical protein
VRRNCRSLQVVQRRSFTLRRCGLYNNIGLRAW